VQDSRKGGKKVVVMTENFFPLTPTNCRERGGEGRKPPQESYFVIFALFGEGGRENNQKLSKHA